LVSNIFKTFQINHTDTSKPVKRALLNEVDETAMRAEFIKKQKELLELKQKTLELELLHIKKQKKEMNKINVSKVNSLN